MFLKKLTAALLLTALIVLTTACSNGEPEAERAEVEEPAPEVTENGTEAPALEGVDIVEIYEQSLEAVDRANSMVYELRVEQTLDFPEMMEMTSVVNASGRSIQSPMAQEMSMKIDAAGMAMEMDMFIVDNRYYVSMPEMGWVWQDIEEDSPMMMAQENPFDYIDMFREAGPESARITEENGSYVISFKDNSEDLLAVLESYALAQMGADFFGDEDMQEMFEEVKFSRANFRMVLDSETLLPSEVIFNYKMSMKMAGERMNIDQNSTIKYFEFGTFDSITVPQEIIDSAVPIEEMYEIEGE